MNANVSSRNGYVRNARSCRSLDAWLMAGYGWKRQLADRCCKHLYSRFRRFGNVSCCYEAVVSGNGSGLPHRIARRTAGTCIRDISRCGSRGVRLRHADRGLSGSKRHTADISVSRVIVGKSENCLPMRSCAQHRRRRKKPALWRRFLIAT